MDPQNPGPGVCDGGQYYDVHCDGPNDCNAGQVCCKQSQYIESHYLCFNGASCPVDYDRTYFSQVCDPLQPVCPADKPNCKSTGSGPYLCVDY
jgi:hypothetical protein